MLWKLLLSCFAFFARPFHGPPVDDIPYEASPFGPQSWREAHMAMQALQGDHDDMRFHEDWPTSAGIKDTKFRWPGYAQKKPVVYYTIDSSLKSQVNLINDAIKQYHDNTCIKFEKRTNQAHYVRMIKGQGCYSYVGYMRRGAQPLSLGNGCYFVGTIVHELGHAIGLYHEHQRSDRDTYLNVYMDNVVTSPRNQKHNFNKTLASQELIYTEYDYKSIMHYGEYAFSKQPKVLKTMEAKDGTPLKEPYDKAGLNQNDIDMINKLYNCEK